MPKARYLLVEGVTGQPVTDPHAPPLMTGQIARFAGWKFTPQKVTVTIKGQTHDVCDPDVDGLIDHYTPEQQVIKDHSDLRSAIKHGHLKMHGEVIAKNHEDARAQLLKLGKLTPSTTTIGTIAKGDKQ